MLCSTSPIYPTDHRFLILWPNGSVYDRWIPEGEADKEWEDTIKALSPGYTAVRYVNNVEVERFWHDPSFNLPPI